MRTNSWSNLMRWLTGASALAFALTVPAFGQAPPPTPDAKADAEDKDKDDAKEDAKDAEKDAKAAADKAKDAAEDASDRAKDAKEAAQDRTRDAKDRAKNTRDSAKNRAKGAKDQARDVRDTARGAAKDARGTAADALDADRAPDARTREPRDRRETRSSRDSRDRDRAATRDLDRSDVDARDRDEPEDRDARDDRDPADDRELREDERSTEDREVRRSSRDARSTDRTDARSTDRTEVRTDARVSSQTDFSARNVRSADVGLWFDRSASDALVISDIATTGAIASLGFREGDRIVSINDQRVVREAEFIEYLFADEVVDDRVKVVVLRDNREEVIYVEPRVLIEEYWYVDNDPLEHFGVVIDDRYDDRIVVWKVIPRSPAFYAGLRPGDVITTFRGQPIATRQEFVSVVSNLEPGEVPLQITRRERTRDFVVDVPEFQAQTERRTTLRPSADVERPNAVREERIENRRDTRREIRERADERPSLTPTVPPQPNPVPNPPRPGILPRRR